MKRRRRLVLLASTGLITIAASLGYMEFYLSRPIGQGAVSIEVSDGAFKTEWTDRPVVVLGIGDSITAGLGATVPELSFFRRMVSNPENDFADMHGKCLAKVLPNLHAQNIALSGTTSLQHQSFIQGRLTQFSDEVYGVVVITTGGNDLIHSYGRNAPREGAMYGATIAQAEPWIKDFEARLNGMLSDIEDLFPGGNEVHLANIYDPTDGVGDAPSIFLPDWPDGLAIHARYNKVIARVADQRENVFLVDLYSAFLGHGSHCRQFWRAHYEFADPHYWFYYNVEDPNDRGYDAIRRLFLNSISQNFALAEAG